MDKNETVGASRVPKVHHLKLDSKYIDMVMIDRIGIQTRRNDRDFQVGDILHLHRYDSETGMDPDAIATRSIVRMYRDLPGLDPDYVALLTAPPNCSYEALRNAVTNVITRRDGIDPCSDQEKAFQQRKVDDLRNEIGNLQNEIGDMRREIEEARSILRALPEHTLGVAADGVMRNLNETKQQFNRMATQEALASNLVKEFKAREARSINQRIAVREHVRAMKHLLRATTETLNQ